MCLIIRNNINVYGFGVEIYTRGYMRGKIVVFVIFSDRGVQYDLKHIC